MGKKAKAKNRKSYRMSLVRINRNRFSRRKRKGLKYKGKLTMLLGAGFSKLAGLPLGQEINDRFDRDLRDKLLKNGSSEWMWVDGKSDAEIQNGRLTNAELGYSYIFNELVNSYKGQSGKFVDYEDFFGFTVIIVKQQSKIEAVYDKARTRMLDDYSDRIQDGYFLPFEQPPDTIVEIFNYLIADLLKIKAPDEELVKIYAPIIQILRWFKDVEIFTLNHDLLLEHLLYLLSIRYCDGFTTKNSNISEDRRILPTFQNRFNKRYVKVEKLHGSINCFRFEHTKEFQHAFYRTGKYTYFKTNDFYEKHHARRINATTGNTIQQFNPDIVPKFISGKNKLVDIKKDMMFSLLYNNFEKSMKQSTCILISGYSFRDDHINNYLNQSRPGIVINQNPSQNYPFKQKCINIKTFEEVKGLAWGKLY